MGVDLTSSLLGMDRAEIAALVSEAGEPGYRAKQIMDAVYRQRVESLEEISTLPQEFRERLAQSGVTVGAAQIEKKFVSVDGTVRYLIGFRDGQSVETVWMPEGDGGEAGDGSEAGEEADDSGSGTSGAEAHRTGWPIAALKRCATQKPEHRAVDDLHFQSGGVCCRLPVLFDCAAGGKAQSYCGRDCGAGLRGAQRSRGFSAGGSHQSGFHGDGRAVSELRQFY